MERLTRRDITGIPFCQDVGYLDMLNKLAAYEDAEEQGRLVVLPVKAGDTVYQLRGKKHARGVGISQRFISCVTVWDNFWAAYHQGDIPCNSEDLGKTWFLTREEAEKALEGMKNNG